MARLCIRIAPNNHPTDPSLDVMRTQTGDVVCVVEDGHKWSDPELNCGQYKFIDMPGVPPEKLLYLMEHVEKSDTVIIARRKVSLDVVALKTIDEKEATESDIAAVVAEKPKRLGR